MRVDRGQGARAPDALRAGRRAQRVEGLRRYLEAASFILETYEARKRLALSSERSDAVHGSARVELPGARRSGRLGPLRPLTKSSAAYPLEGTAILHEVRAGEARKSRTSTEVSRSLRKVRAEEARKSRSSTQVSRSLRKVRAEEARKSRTSTEVSRTLHEVRA